VATIANLNPAQRATARHWTGARWDVAEPAVRLWTRIRCRAERAIAQVRVPADVRALAPAEPGEHILTFAHNPDSALVVATDRALRHQADGGWSRIGWEQVSQVTWDADRHILALTDAATGRAAEIALHASDGARLTDLARERIASTVLLSTLTTLTNHGPARMTGRRQPGTERTLWQVSLGNGADATDPTLRAAVAAAVAELRAQFEA
jgi:hypothetical protein